MNIDKKRFIRSAINQRTFPTACAPQQARSERTGRIARVVVRPDVPTRHRLPAIAPCVSLTIALHLNAIIFVEKFDLNI